MSEPKVLTPEEAAKLLALPTKTRGSGTTRTSGSRTVRINTDDRSHVMWWKLETTAIECTVPNHDESESERKRMCAAIGDLLVCRYCYVSSRDVSIS